MLTKFNQKELLALDPEEIFHQLSKEEIIGIFKAFGAFWSYDHKAAAEGRVGCHAELSSGLCGEGFFNSELVLAHDNLCEIFAKQLVMKYRSLHGSRPGRIIPVPRGASKLGIAVASDLDLPVGTLKKTGVGFELEDEVAPGELLLLIDDFCFGATNLSHAMLACIRRQPKVLFTEYQLVIMDLGGRSIVSANGKSYGLAASASYTVPTYRPANCPHCRNGSKRLRPKENWRSLITSQRSA